LAFLSGEREKRKNRNRGKIGGPKRGSNTIKGFLVPYATSLEETGRERNRWTGTANLISALRGDAKRKNGTPTIGRGDHDGGKRSQSATF